MGEGRELVAPEAPAPAPAPAPDAVEDRAGEWRRRLGANLTESQQLIDANLTLFRVACLLTMVGSAVAAVRFSGLMSHFVNVDEIPLGHFLRRKKLHVRLIRQSTDDPNVFYVYHTPFARRVFLKDTLPSDTLVQTQKKATLLAVRPFGVQVDESAEEWIWANFVSSHRYMTVELLHRLAMPEGVESIATCNMSVQKTPLWADFAEELVAHGYAECMPEDMHHYDNGLPNDLSTLAKRLERLEAAEKRAKSMQYGIWSGWQPDKLSERVLSAGKRATANGIRKIFGRTK